MMSGLVSDLMSVRVPTCPLERAKPAVSDTIFRGRQVREVLGISDPELSTVHYAQYQTSEDGLICCMDLRDVIR